MSDLAPFVAAALRDRVVLAQQEEIHTLQHRVQALQEELHPAPRRVRVIHAPTGNVWAQDDHVDLEQQQPSTTTGADADRIQLFTGGAIDLCMSAGELGETQVEFSLAAPHDNKDSGNDTVTGNNRPLVVPIRRLTLVSIRYFKCGFMQETYAYFRMEDTNGSSGLQLHGHLGPLTMEEYATDFVQVPSSQFVVPRVPVCDAVVYDGVERWVDNDSWWQTLADKPVKIVLDEGACHVDRNFLKSIGKTSVVTSAMEH